MAYATVEEFFRRAKIDSPSEAQTDAATKMLDAAAHEIDAYLDWIDNPPATEPSEGASAILENVNIERASESWRLLPFGAFNQGPELPTLVLARDSFDRYRHKLASLKVTAGIA